MIIEFKKGEIEGVIIDKLNFLIINESGDCLIDINVTSNKEVFINDVLEQNDLLECFRMNRSLPDRYGYRLDERAVEYPWLFSRLNIEKRLLLDAGSTLNFQYLLFNKWLNPQIIQESIRKK